MHTCIQLNTTRTSNHPNTHAQVASASTTLTTVHAPPATVRHTVALAPDQIKTSAPAGKLPGQMRVVLLEGETYWMFKVLLGTGTLCYVVSRVRAPSVRVPCSNAGFTLINGQCIGPTENPCLAMPCTVSATGLPACAHPCHAGQSCLTACLLIS